MKLSDYNNPSKTKIENLTEFLDDNGKWQEDYIDYCPDFLDGYLELASEGEIYLGELDDETKALVEYLVENNEIDLIYDSCRGELTRGIWRLSNEIWSCNLGELEVQFSGLYDTDTKTNCIYTELIKGMSESEIKEAEDNSEYYISGDCIYIDYSQDRASLILDEDLLIDNFLKEAV